MIIINHNQYCHGNNLWKYPIVTFTNSNHRILQHQYETHGTEVSSKIRPSQSLLVVTPNGQQRCAGNYAGRPGKPRAGKAPGMAGMKNGENCDTVIVGD
jgi:hypothetical protein